MYPPIESFNIASKARVYKLFLKGQLRNISVVADHIRYMFMLFLVFVVLFLQHLHMCKDMATHSSILA